MVTEKKQSIHQTINTVILTVLGIVSIMIYFKITNLQEQSTTISNQNIILVEKTKTLETQVIDHNARLVNLEMQQATQIKDWVEANFQRKDL